MPEGIPNNDMIHRVCGIIRFSDWLFDDLNKVHRFQEIPEIIYSSLLLPCIPTLESPIKITSSASESMSVKRAWNREVRYE
ncbi:hypothetical protein J6590_084228 [Homalodisca vitripennis]|nr:hypothetical protein J6590_084228 [Homalodisca vitripennis]